MRPQHICWWHQAVWWLEGRAARQRDLGRPEGWACENLMGFYKALRCKVLHLSQGNPNHPVVLWIFLKHFTPTIHPGLSLPCLIRSALINLTAFSKQSCTLWIASICPKSTIYRCNVKTLNNRFLKWICCCSQNIWIRVFFSQLQSSCSTTDLSGMWPLDHIPAHLARSCVNS